MRVSHSTHQLPSRGGDEQAGRTAEVHVIDVRGTSDDFLCRLFVQPTERGCHVQIDGRPDPDERNPGARLSVTALEDLLFVGVEPVVP